MLTGDSSLKNYLKVTGTNTITFMTGVCYKINQKTTAFKIKINLILFILRDFNLCICESMFIEITLFTLRMIVFLCGADGFGFIGS